MKKECLLDFVRSSNRLRGSTPQRTNRLDSKTLRSSFQQNSILVLTGTLARTGNVILPGWGLDAKSGPDKVDGSFSEYSELLGDPSKKLRFATLNFCLFPGFCREFTVARSSLSARVSGKLATGNTSGGGKTVFADRTQPDNDSRLLVPPPDGVRQGTRIGGFRSTPYNAGAEATSPSPDRKLRNRGWGEAGTRKRLVSQPAKIGVHVRNAVATSPETERHPPLLPRSWMFRRSVHVWIQVVVFAVRRLAGPAVTGRSGFPRNGRLGAGF